MNKVVMSVWVVALVTQGCGSDSGGTGKDAGGVQPVDSSAADSDHGGDGVSGLDSGSDVGSEPDSTESNWGTIVAVDGIVVDQFVPLGAPVVDLSRNETNLACTPSGVYLVSDAGDVSGPLTLPAACSRVDFRSLPYVTDADGAVHRLKLQPSLAIEATYLGSGSGYHARTATGDDANVYVAAGEAGLLHIQVTTGAVSPLGLAVGAVDVTPIVGSDPVVLAVATDTGLSIVDVAMKSEKKIDIWGGSWRVAEVWPSPDLALIVAGPLGSQFVRLDAQYTPTLVGAAVGRGVPLDVAAFKGCAVAAEWNNVARYGCTEDIAWVFGEELWGLGGVASTRSHVSAIETDGTDVIVVGTEQGLVWLTMGNTATGPDAYFATNRLDFRGVSSGDSESVGVILANDGDAPLLVKSISVDNLAFSIEIDPDFAGNVQSWTPTPLMVVEANTALGFFEVRFRPESDDMVTATLRIETNDIDEPIIEIPVAGNSPNLVPGDKAPDMWLPSMENHRVGFSSLTGTVRYIKFFNGL